MKWILAITAAYLIMGVIIIDGGGNPQPGLYPLQNPFPHNTYNYPNITIHTPTNGTTYTNNNIQTNITTNGGTPPQTCRYRINLNSWNNITCTYSKNITYPGGTVTLTAETTDQYGLTNTDQKTFKVSTRPGQIPKIQRNIATSSAIFGFIMIITLLLITNKQKED